MDAPGGAAQPTPPPCRFYAAGRCDRGTSCRFRHDGAPGAAAAAVAAPAASVPAEESAYALVIVPPPGDWAPFVAIKSRHMNPRIRRPPYPHITLVGRFPNRDPEQAVQRARELVQGCEGFDLEIAEFKVFQNARNCTVYLEPRESDGRPHMRDLHQCLQASFRANDFEPHIGVCFCNSAREANELKQRYQADFPPIRFRVTHLYVMKRNGDEDPFQPWAAIPLKGEADTPLQHVLVRK